MSVVAVASTGDSSESPIEAGLKVKLTEIFLSLQGESTSVGWPTVFVRLTGCPLRCTYCDTAYAFHGGAWHSIEEVLAHVRSHGVRHVCVTGGEPLAQKSCRALMTSLCDAGYIVSLETSGALDVSVVDPRVIKVVDLKTPASGEMMRNRLENLSFISTQDQIKFVICNREDYEWARSMVAARDLSVLCTVLFSPSQDQLPARELADWIIADRLPVRFQLQLHKILWGGEPGR